MNSWTSFAKRAERLILDNSPAILTAVGITGTITTAYLTGKASFKAADILRRDHEAIAREWTPEPAQPFRRDVELVWRLYIPAGVVGTATIVCIIGANRVGTRRAAAMAAAYSLSEKAFVEYKDKVIEKFGENKELALRDDLAQDRVKDNPPNKEVVIVEDGKVLCFDSFTARYFRSTMEELKKAQNDINYQVINHMYASLSDFYDKVGLPTTAFSDDVGWNSDELLELEFSTVLSEDGKPCISINFLVSPGRGFYKVH